MGLRDVASATLRRVRLMRTSRQVALLHPIVSGITSVRPSESRMKITQSSYGEGDRTAEWRYTARKEEKQDTLPEAGEIGLPEAGGDRPAMPEAGGDWDREKDRDQRGRTRRRTV
jgi:hypothetical protein